MNALYVFLQNKSVANNAAMFFSLGMVPKLLSLAEKLL